MSSPKKILFYVQHLLGIGHLKRATTLARAFADKGIEVTLVSGGEFVSVVDADGIQFVQLPAVKATDRTFSGLVNSEGADIDDDLKESRKDKLLSFHFLLHSIFLYNDCPKRKVHLICCFFASIYI